MTHPALPVIVILCSALVAHPAVARAASDDGTLESSPPPHPTLDPRRLHVYAQLVELDYTPLDARDAVAQLTVADLDVFCAHPGMLQRAGAMDVQTQAFIVGAIIVAVIVLLATSSDSTTVVMIN
ncbi:MAG: hypothetical protein GY715_08055 [Planctomycetes bacterium]|nr:hypothetical protein [Planctomycetota bacterium]